MSRDFEGVVPIFLAIASFRHVIHITELQVVFFVITVMSAALSGAVSIHQIGRSVMRCIGLLMVAGVIGFSNSAEGQTQVLDKANRGVLWIDTGGEVPENAVRVRVEKGRPLCRGAHSEPKAKKWWRDIGVYDKGKGACHTLRNKKNLKFQEEFYFLVPEPMSAEVEELLAETDEFIGEVDLLLGGDDSVIDKWEDEIVEEQEEVPSCGDGTISMADARRVPELAFVKLFSHVASGGEPDSQ